MQIESLKNNSLIGKTMLKMYPASFVDSVTMSFSFMVDMLLAGMFFGSTEIAAIGIASPIGILLSAVISCVVVGASLQIATSLGRGKKEDCNKHFSLSFFFVLLFGALFVGLSIAFAKPLVKLFGAREESLASIAIMYLIFNSPMIITGNLSRLFGSTLGVYGYHEDNFSLTLTGLILNVAFSLMLIGGMRINWIPDIGIGALAAGTWLSQLVVVIITYMRIKKRKLKLKIKRFKFKFKDLSKLAKSGFASSSDQMIDSTISGIINNIIVSALGAVGLAIYSVVRSICMLASTASMAIGRVAGPFFGIFYGSRDKNGLKKTLTEGFKWGLIISVVWEIILFALLPLLIMLYMRKPIEGVDYNTIMRTGVLIIFIFLPFKMFVQLMSNYYQSTERFSMTLLFSIIPDSLLFPVMLLILTPILGYMGIWLSFGGFPIVFVILFFIMLLIIKNKRGIHLDDFLQIDKRLKDSVPMLDVSVNYTNNGVTNFTEQLQKFLSEEKINSRTAYMSALCIEELAADFIAHSKDNAEKINEGKELMDIKLFSDENSLRIIIRNIAKPYNPLDFEYDAENYSKIGVKMAQKLAQKINYNYVYKMNIITIDMAKTRA